MPNYHVRITQKSSKWDDEVKLDLSLEELNQRILDSYHDGRPITIGGKAIATDDIERIVITKTVQDSTVLRSEAEQQKKQSGIITPAISVEWYIADMGEDVTDEFITGPPGEKLESASHSIKELRPATNVREVFVVHGRNEKARLAMFTFLRSIGLDPIEWSEAVKATGKATPYIGEILDAAFSRAHAVVVLFTPDDEARLREPYQANNDPPHETRLTGQARPNVLFEAGMAMARDQDRTVLVELGQLRPFSDIAGRYAIRLNNSTQLRQELAQRLELAGCPVNWDGTDWHTAGEFDDAVASTVQNSPESATALEQQLTSGESLELSDDAKELLMEAANDRQGMIRMISTLGGLIIKTGNRSFVETGDPKLEARSEARWKQAVQDLVDHGLIEDPTGKGKFFEVTHSGFQLADRLRASENSDAE